MTAAQSGPGFGCRTVEAAGGAGVDHLLTPGREIAEEGSLVAHQRGVEARGEGARLRRWYRGVDRPALGLPLRQPAVEDRNFVMPEEAQHPPGAPRRGEPGAIIDDDAVIIADTQR